MRHREQRADHGHLAVDADEKIATSDTLSWIVHGLNPIIDEDLPSRTGVSASQAGETQQRIRSDSITEAVREGLWLSIEGPGLAHSARSLG
jgi:hypothetical protein